MTPESELVLRPADARRAGYCVPGIRSWFTEKGLDFRAFARGELTAADIREAVGDDALLDRTIEAARGR